MTVLASGCPLPFLALIILVAFVPTSLFVGDSAFYLSAGLVSGGLGLWLSCSFYLNCDQWCAALDRRSTKGYRLTGSSTCVRMRNATARYGGAFRVMLCSGAW